MPNINLIIRNEKENDYEADKEIKKGKPPVASPQIASYVAVLKGELPVRFNASRKKDILKTLAFGRILQRIFITGEQIKHQFIGPLKS